MRGPIAEMVSTSAAGQSRERLGQAVDTNLKYIDESEHVWPNRHTSDPEHFQRAHSASISSSFQRNSSIACASSNALPVCKSRLEAALAPGRELKAKLDLKCAEGQNRDRHGQTVDEDDQNHDSEHLCMSRHTSDPGHFQRAQSVNMLSSFRRHSSIAGASNNALSASKTSRIEAAFAPRLTTRGLKAQLESATTAGQNRDGHGQAVEEKDRNQLKCSEDSEHLCMSRHTSDPGHFQLAQSASMSTTMISSSFKRYSSIARASAGSSSNTLSASKASCLEAAMQTPGKHSRSLTAWVVKDSLDEEEKRTRSRGHFQRSASGSSSFQRNSSITRASGDTLSANKTSCLEAAPTPRLTMREFKALLASSSGQNRDQYGQADEDKDQEDRKGKITFCTEKRFMILSAIAVNAVAGCFLVILIFWMVSAHQRMALSQR